MYFVFIGAFWYYKNGDFVMIYFYITQHDDTTTILARDEFLCPRRAELTIWQAYSEQLDTPLFKRVSLTTRDAYRLPN